MWSQMQTSKILIRNLLLQFIFSGVQLGLTTKTGGRGCGPNMVEYRFVTIKWLTSPIGTDQIEHAMFNRVPFGSAGRIMGDGDNQAKFIGQELETHFPNPTSVAIGATTVSFNQQILLVRIEQLSYHQPPHPNGGDSKLWGIVRSPERDKALILADVINTVGNGDALGQTWNLVFAQIHPISILFTQIDGISIPNCYLVLRNYCQNQLIYETSLDLASRAKTQYMLV